MVVYSKLQAVTNFLPCDQESIGEHGLNLDGPDHGRRGVYITTGLSASLQ